MGDTKEALSEELIELKYEMRELIRDTHSSLDGYIDGEEDLSDAEEPLRRGFHIYRQMNDLSTRALLSQSEAGSGDSSPVPSYEQTLKDLESEITPAVEFASMIESQRDYEDALVRYLGIRHEEPIMGRELQDLLEEDINLPEGIEPDILRDEAEIIE